MKVLKSVNLIEPELLISNSISILTNTKRRPAKVKKTNQTNPSTILIGIVSELMKFLTVALQLIDRQIRTDKKTFGDQFLPRTQYLEKSRSN